MHLSSSGLLALIFSGSGEVAYRFWPESHAVYNAHTGVYIGTVGGLVVSCHDADVVLWRIQTNKARLHGLLKGHRAQILKVRQADNSVTLVVCDDICAHGPWIVIE